MTEDSDTSNPKRPGARVLSSFVFLGTTGSVYTRCAMRERQFDSNEWITKLAAAIEEDVTRSDAPWLDYPEEPPHDSAEGDRQWRLRQYGALARRAKTDAVAARQFAKSRFRLVSVSNETKSILRGHPALAGADASSSQLEGIRVQLLNRSTLLDFDSLLSRLAKVSLVDGADGAAGLLDRFLSDGEAGRLPAEEIILVRGLSLGGRIELAEGAYLAPYEDARSTFRLPDEPDEWVKSGGIDPARWNRSSATAALVRPLTWRPGFAAGHRDGGSPFEPVCYGFPPDHAVGSIEQLFQDRSLLIDLLSAVVGSRLISHTSFVAVPNWIRIIDPNVANPRVRDGSAGLFDVWPKDQALGNDDAATFAALARGWIAYRRTHRSIDLAVRRVASSLGPVAGEFGLEDRLLDLGVAMEAMYGPLKFGRIKRQLKAR